MIYGYMVANKPNNKQINIESVIDQELKSFNRLCESINVLTENGIVFEFSWNDIKAKAKEIWTKFKNGVIHIWEIIKEKFQNLISKLKKQKVDKAVDDLKKNCSNASNDEIQNMYEKLFSSQYDTDAKNGGGTLYISYFNVNEQDLSKAIGASTNPDLFIKLVTENNGGESHTYASDQSKIAKIKAHNNDIIKQIIDPIEKELEKLDKLDTKFDPKDAIGTLTKSKSTGNNTTYIAPVSDEHYKYRTPLEAVKKILAATPEDFYFSHSNPIDKIIERYESALEKALAGTNYTSDDASYFMSGLSYDISNMKKQQDLAANLYHVTYSAITYNMKLVYYIAEKFNVYMGRLKDSDYKKLNNRDYQDAYKNNRLTIA